VRTSQVSQTHKQDWTGSVLTENTSSHLAQTCQGADDVSRFSCRLQHTANWCHQTVNYWCFQSHQTITDLIHWLLPCLNTGLLQPPVCVPPWYKSTVHYCHWSTPAHCLTTDHQTSSDTPSVCTAFDQTSVPNVHAMCVHQSWVVTSTTALLSFVLLSFTHSRLIRQVSLLTARWVGGHTSTVKRGEG